MRQVFINTDKGRREVFIPERWEEVTTAQYIKLSSEWDGKDLIRLFSILTGIPYRVIFDSHDYALEQNLIYATAFIFEEKIDFKSLPVPETFHVKGKEVKVPKDIKGLSIGQNIHIISELQNAQVYDQLIALAIAIYLEPLYTGQDFNYEHAKELEQDILLMPITKTYSLGFFLLKPVMRSGRSSMMPLNRIRILLQNIFMRSVKDRRSQLEPSY